MKVGTPGFVGARLREAREARGMTAMSLAEILGVSRQAISQYEAGHQTPRPDVMEKLPELLNVKPRFFFRDTHPDSMTPLFFRSLSAATKTARTRARHRQAWLHEVIRFVEGFVELPAVNIPTFDLPKDPTQLTAATIEDSARQVRRFWKLGDGAISDLILLLENNGVVVSRGELWSDHLDAFSRWRDERPFIFLSSEKASAVRSRLDAAHELGHLILHRDLPAELIGRKEIFRLIEEQAFRFAGAFLLPAESFAADLRIPSLELMRAIKPTWKVSIKAMLVRAIELHLVPEQSALWRSFSRRGWTREEPLDRELVPEQPRLLRRAIELIVSSGVCSREELAARFDFSPKDIEELAALTPGFLGSKPPTVRLLEFPAYKHKAKATDQQAGNGAVLHFPSTERLDD